MDSEQIERALRPLEQRVRALEGSRVAVPLRPGGGPGGGLNVTDEKHLPEIPTKGARLVVWLNAAAGGTGNSRLWVAAHGYTHWEPLDHTSDLEGNPGD